MKCNMCKKAEATHGLRNPWGDLHVLCEPCVPLMKKHYEGYGD